MERQIQRPGQFLHKFLVRVGFRAPQSVMQMSHM